MQTFNKNTDFWFELQEYLWSKKAGFSYQDYFCAILLNKNKRNCKQVQVEIK